MFTEQDIPETTEQDDAPPATGFAEIGTTSLTWLVRPPVAPRYDATTIFEAGGMWYLPLGARRFALGRSKAMALASLDYYNQRGRLNPGGLELRLEDYAT